VEQLIIGTRPGETGYSQQAVRLVRDLYRFIVKIGEEKDTIVHVNPSLDPKSLVRDGLFIMIAKLFGKKTLVFFRGWHAEWEEQIEKKWRRVFRFVFGHADAFIVLSEAFRLKLRSWIGDKPIYLEFAILDDDALLDFTFSEALEKRLSAKPRRILFISRLIKEKGLYEVIDAVGLLSVQHPQVELVVAGDGPELKAAEKYASDAGYGNIRFIGYVRGDLKTQVLREAYLLCFPTYGEGMPNTVIECMGFGLPVITRPVGGLVDFFQNGVHGYATQSKDPQVFADLIRNLVEDRPTYVAMANHNYNYARMHFKSARAASRLEGIYKALSAPAADPESKIAALVSDAVSASSTGRGATSK
jgi:glycosyltransferase involved in cell wall biosynthesis